MTALALLLAYVLPLPIMAACFYYHIFDGIADLPTRLIAIGITCLAPSAALMIFVLERILHLIFYAVCIAAVLFGLHHFGLIGPTGATP